MKLIEEILENLSSDSPDLNNALVKTKVLLHRLGEDQLISWVNSELNGYKEVESVPDYRIIRLSIHGNATNMAWRYYDQPLPLSHLDKTVRNQLQTHRLTQSIAVIESYAKDDKDLTTTIAPELFSLLSKGLADGYVVERAFGKPSVGAMLQVITEVRSRLLDFVLELSERLPDELDKNEMKERSKEIGTSDLFNNALFGDNATIIVGSHNIQNIQNSIIKNDFESLANVLLKHSMDERDVEVLRQAIQKDEGSSEHTERIFGQNVRGWISIMLNKAIESVWSVNLGVAGGLIADALNAYYGWF